VALVRRQLERVALIDVALGNEPADTVILGGRVVDVHTAQVRREGVAIKNGRIAALGDIEYTRGDATEVIDADGSYLVPGLVNPHLHQWHTYTNCTVFALTNLLHGTTAIADGFYGHAILTGIKSVRFFLDELLATPVKPIFLAPTMAYTQNRFLGLPLSPNAPTPEDLFAMLDWPETVGTEETGYELIFDKERRDPVILELLEETLRRGKVVTGHGAGLSGDRQLNAFVAAGMMNDHEIVGADEARRKAELGLTAHIREGAGCEDTKEVVRAILEHGLSPRAFNLCSDVVTTEAMISTGAQDNGIRVAVRNGLSPMTAIQMSTIQPAEFFRVNHDIGSITPGRYADIVFVENLADFEISRVMANGTVWVEGGELVQQAEQPEYPAYLYETMNVKRPVEAADFRVEAGIPDGTAVVRAIAIAAGSLVSEEEHEELAIEDGNVVADPARGINKVAMIDRVAGSGDVGVAFVKGFGLTDGAIGCSANVFNQQIVVVGADEGDMAVAANAIAEMGGGFVAVRDGVVVADFPTPLNGIVSDLGYDATTTRIDELLAAWRDMGCELTTPQINLEFITLVTIPRLRISTKGLAVVSSDSYEFVDAVVSTSAAVAAG
jgi:adenine deaminase